MRRLCGGFRWTPISLGVVGANDDFQLILINGLGANCDLRCVRELRLI
jgi:hypothetical protein